MIILKFYNLEENEMDTVDFAVVEVLWGHVEHRSEPWNLVKRIWTGKDTRKPEIDNFNFQSLSVNQNVLQFDVSMSNFVMVYTLYYINYTLEHFVYR